MLLKVRPKEKVDLRKKIKHGQKETKYKKGY